MTVFGSKVLKAYVILMWSGAVPWWGGGGGGEGGTGAFIYLFYFVCMCAGAKCWWNKTPFVSFPCQSQNVSSTTSQSPELLKIQCEFIWKETVQLVSRKVEVNACQFYIAVAQLLLSQPKNFPAHPHELYVYVLQLGMLCEIWENKNFKIAA